jgi:dTDP-4-dehydrorhamnose reductase
MSADKTPVVLVTGGEGLLGRAIVKACVNQNFKVLSVSRKSKEFPLDITNYQHVHEFLDLHKPTFIINCAAERRPDACEQNIVESELLNIHAVYNLALEASKLPSCGFVQISTDYIFDGKNAPYSETDAPNPLNAYGKQKLRGEHAALAGNSGAIILRVPVLYGPTSDFSESAVTAFIETVRKNKASKVDDWQIRVPTLTSDIALVVVNMVKIWHDEAVEAGSNSNVCSRSTLPGIWNYCSQDIFTRFSLCKYFASKLNLDMSNIEAVAGPPAGAVRPYDCFLSTKKMQLYDNLFVVPTQWEVGVSNLLG